MIILFKFLAFLLIFLRLPLTTKGYGHGRDAGVFAAAPPPKFLAGTKPAKSTSSQLVPIGVC
jgi:hypothetical protein